MYFDSLQALLHMDGHGPYVWTVYGLAVVALGLNIVAPLWRRRRFIAAHRGRLQRAAASTPAPTSADNQADD